MSKKSVWVVVLVGTFSLLCGGNSWGNETEDGKQGKAGKMIRVGTYDNRAIAIAYTASKFNPVKEKMEEYKKAKADGDKKRCDELQAWGERLQRDLHRQGFCFMPVDNLLECVKDDLAKLAEKENLDLIVLQYNFAAPNVEIIDITDQIVALYDPPEKALRYVKEIKKHPPLSLETVEKHGHNHQHEFSRRACSSLGGYGTLAK